MWGDDFHKKFQILEKIFFILFYFIYFFLCYDCCSINLKRQSEHSGLHSDTSSLVQFRSIPLTSSAKKDQLDRTPPSSASHHNTLTRRSLNASPIDDLASTSSKLLIEEALPFSLKPFVVHPPSEDDRTPSLNECQAIIAQLSFHCQNQHQEVCLMEYTYFC